METYEDVLNQFEPMIHACIRKLRIYKNHDSFIQVGRVGLWKAWQRYDSSKGDFAPFAYRSIYGSLLDELKKAANEENILPAEDQLLEILLNKPAESSVDSEELINALSQLNLAEQQLIQLLFIDRSSLDKVALHFGITKAGVKKKRQRTLQKLKRIMTT
ncbi:MAG: sigma-70 family RNA polymerase sigma factor [Paenisporosarcina sp.]